MSKFTLLAGLYVNPRSHIRLKTIYKRTYQLLQKLPQNSSYKINTEAIICHRLSIVNEAGDDHREIEDNICCGKIELLISQAEAEYALVQKMLVWKPWEKLVEVPPKTQLDWPPAVPS